MSRDNRRCVGPPRRHCGSALPWVLLAISLGVNVFVAAFYAGYRYAGGANSCQQATTAFMGGTPDERAAAYAAANVRDRRLNVPVHLLQGDDDTIVPALQSVLPGAATTLQPGAGHFDWIHPGARAYATLLETLQEWNAR